MNWNTKIKEALDRSEFMALGTVDAEGVWTCPVVFSYDEKCNLYFISRLGTRHAQNIEQDPRVSVAIYKTERTTHDGVIGLQGVGTARQIDEPAELAECIGLYFNRNVVNDEYKNEAASAPEEGSWRVFKITLNAMWYFNSNEYGTTGRVAVDLAGLEVPSPQ